MKTIMNSIAKYLAYFLGLFVLFFGGGFSFTIFGAFILDFFHIMPPNDSFIIGMIWGTGGSITVYSMWNYFKALVINE